MWAHSKYPIECQSVSSTVLISTSLLGYFQSKLTRPSAFNLFFRSLDPTL